MKRRVLSHAVVAAFTLALTSQTLTAVAQTSEDSVTDGVFDVGGHGLYLNCQGSGLPTIVYMHGSIEDPSITPHANGMFAQRALADEYRVCVYDRRNLGESDTVDAPQLPEDAIADRRVSGTLKR